MKSFLRGLAGALVGGLIAGFVMGSANLPRVHLDGAGVLMLLIGLVPMLMLAIAIHEAGHLFAGAAVGFRPYLFIVGPLKLERTDRRWRVGLNRSISFVGGLSAGIPNDTLNLRKRLMVLVAGGPAASLAGGLVASALLVAVSPAAGIRMTGAAAGSYYLLLGLALMSFMVAFIALVPGKKSGYSSDGAQIGRFMRNDKEVEAEVALTTVSLSSLAGRRPRDWDADLLAQAMTLPLESGRGALAHLLAHINALDRHDLEAARRFLDTALAHAEHVPLMSRAGIFLQAAQFAALYDRDARAARAALDRARGGALVSSSEQLFTEATVRHVEGGPNVDQLLDRAETALSDSIDRGSSQLRADQIAPLRQLRRG
jgi:hypothetical protein